MSAATLERPTKRLEKMKSEELRTLARNINGLGHKGLRKIDFTPQTPCKALRNRIRGALRDLEDQGALVPSGSA